MEASLLGTDSRIVAKLAKSYWLGFAFFLIELDNEDIGWIDVLGSFTVVHMHHV